MAEAVEINVPFNNPITGFCAFTVRALDFRVMILTNGITAQSRHSRKGKPVLLESLYYFTNIFLGNLE